ncbi:MAG: lysophospholipid acyltransferase family protein [bacterium]
MKLRWRLAWLLTYPLAKVVVNLRVEGRENLTCRNAREKRGMIIAANHTSNFDPLILGWAAAREIYFLAKEELFRYRPFGWLIRSWNALPVARGGVDTIAFRRCSRVLRNRQTLVLFPEGTRSKNSALAGFKPGVGMLAVLNSVPVVPAHISGMSRSIISYLVDRDFVRLGLRHKPSGCVQIRVRFGESVLPEGFSRNRQGYEQLTAIIEERVRSLAG